MQNKHILMGFILLCFPYLVVQTSNAIDSSSVITSDMIDLGSSEKGKYKNSLSGNSGLSGFPNVSMANVFVQEGVVGDVKISKSVINWISASDNIVGLRHDEDVEGLIADIDGSNCYLRYGGKKILVYIATENAVYPTWIEPSDIPAVHVTLKKHNPLKVGDDDSSVGQKGATYSSNKETQLMEMVKFAYVNEHESVPVAKLKKIDVIEGVQGYRYKTINFEDDMYVQVYLFKLPPTSVKEKIDIRETDFLLPELCYYPVGVAVEFPDLRKDRFTRVFIVGAEKSEEGRDYGN